MGKVCTSTFLDRSRRSPPGFTTFLPQTVVATEFLPPLRLGPRADNAKGNVVRQSHLFEGVKQRGKLVWRRAWDSKTRESELASLCLSLRVLLA